MADTAAHLVDRVFPEVPVRQWVLSVPFAVRYRLAYDSSLVKDTLHIWVRAVFASIRRRAGIPASNRRPRCGAVTFIQRFSDALNLDPHFHMGRCYHCGVLFGSPLELEGAGGAAPTHASAEGTLVTVPPNPRSLTSAGAAPGADPPVARKEQEFVIRSLDTVLEKATGP